MKNMNNGIYKNKLKRPIDFVLSSLGIIATSPIMLTLTIVGAIEVKGNPFFVQERPGEDEKIFKLVKFRTMTNEKDEEGKLLPDEKRLIPYGRFLRKTSLDELPELFNIWKGDMSIIGPRPLLERYIPYYTNEERKRHNVKPGLTGLAQINGRNALQWNERLAMDVQYVENISLKEDMRIFFKTIEKVIKREDVADAGQFDMKDLDQERAAIIVTDKY